MKISFVHIILLFATLLNSCSHKTDAPADTTETQQNSHSITLTEQQFANAGITTLQPVSDILPRSIYVSGTVDVPPQNLVSVSVPYGGTVRSTSLLPGMKISKGSVVAVLEDPSYIQLQQEYLTTRIRLNLLEKERTRQLQLSQTEATSIRNVEQAQAEYATLSITQKALAEKLLLLGINPHSLSENSLSRSVSVRSPINGFVSKLHANVGAYVQAGSVLVDIVNPTDIHAAFTVFERDIPFVSIGDKVTITLPENTRDTLHATVILVSKTVDGTNGTIVHCHFDSAPTSLLPGMFLQGEIQAKGAAALTVPNNAIVRHNGNTFVFEQTGKRSYTMRQVTVLSSSPTRTAISAIGDIRSSTIVSNGSYILLSALKNVAE